MRAILAAVLVTGVAASDDPQRSVDLNNVVDTVLSKVRAAILAADADTLALPDIEKSFSKGWGYLGVRGSFRGSGGRVGRLSTVVRTGDAALVPVPEGVLLSLDLGLSDLRLSFADCRAAVSYLEVAGQAEILFGKNSIALEMVLNYGSWTCPARLVTLRVEQLEDISVRITGTWQFDWLYQKVVSYLADYSKSALEEIVTEHLRLKISRAMIKYNICHEIPEVGSLVGVRRF